MRKTPARNLESVILVSEAYIAMKFRRFGTGRRYEVRELWQSQ